nr:hypothetical protein Iba_chr11aCG6150 [Ipomoea batatas]GMD55257.1 hypothetical protein Iba_chr11dCG6190 [Ipomoea batatas]GMD58651.1 hypothetical protein Iba_chr11fCG7610 [Ipomoea batatas]
MMDAYRSRAAERARKGKIGGTAMRDTRILKQTLPFKLRTRGEERNVRYEISGITCSSLSINTPGQDASILFGSGEVNKNHTSSLFGLVVRNGRLLSCSDLVCCRSGVGWWVGGWGFIFKLNENDDLVKEVVPTTWIEC